MEASEKSNDRKYYILLILYYIISCMMTLIDFAIRTEVRV